MVESGRWPKDYESSIQQNLKSLATPENIALLAPEEAMLFLLPPPFVTVRRQAAENDYWLHEHSAPHMIDFDLAIQIGDFGLGSDAPILLDYRADRSNPSVIRLKWSNDGTKNKWVRMAENIQHFVDVLEL
ncbi:MAG: hypothetical protein CMJ58_15490 [Planctomycetaceae bacterium]|nr:hypothetical protein [Planctomycetaceae bacterium]